ncbi:MAG: hypothetical protein K2W84_13950 [Burkholderiales bacterium]|nr:hypothetical protein [Burkholderiales bacterium]
MNIPDYEYPVEQCDVPEVRRMALVEYRTFRRKCLDYMRGDSDTSVMNQVHDLAWHTVVFRTLNEARRIEPDRLVNGALWELTTAGYASLMTLGIRRLVDKNPKTDSVWNVIALVERRPELLTREKFICYDGLPYDYEAVQRTYIQSLDMSGGGHVGWLPTSGPEAWAMSEIMHKAFDRLAGNPVKRKRIDTVDLSILAALRDRLLHPAIEKVCAMADRRVAHAERIAEGSETAPIVTYNDIDDALRQIVYVANFLSTSFFYDAAFGSVVRTPQFNVLEALDKPWVTTDNLEKLNRYWHDLSVSMDGWANTAQDEFLLSRQ